MEMPELQRLVAAGESDQVEFKRTTAERSAAAKTVCAMLNALGGFVLFGVSNAGELRGQQTSPRTLEEIAQELRQIEPPAFPEIEPVKLADGTDVIALRVSGGGGPYTFRGRAYLRHGPTTTVMPHQQYERLLLERMHAHHRWENQPAYRIGVEDLDHAEITRTIDEAIRRQRMGEPGSRDPHAMLLGLGLINQGELLNAAVVLFGKTERLLPYYPQCILRMARFRGRDKSEFLDNRQEMGHAFDLFQRAQRFLRDHLPVAGRIVPNVFERIDDPLYPTEALREALANALCHRDYSIGGGAVSVAIYDDRLEISSTGILPFGLTPADLTRPHRSRPWNPLVAQAFYRRGIIDIWGRGTLKIAELTEQAGLTPPEFEVSVGEVTVIFRPTRYVPPTRVGHDLSPLQRELLSILADAGSTTLQDVLHRLPSRCFTTYRPRQPANASASRTGGHRRQSTRSTLDVEGHPTVSHSRGPDFQRRTETCKGGVQRRAKTCKDVQRPFAPTLWIQIHGLRSPPNPPNRRAMPPYSTCNPTPATHP